VTTTTTTITGRLESIGHQGADYWSVANLHVDDRPHDDALLTIVGPLLGCELGDTLELRGNLVEHPTFGAQFKFSAAEVTAPSSAAGITSWLSTLPNIGRVRARKIVEVLGADEVWDTIEHRHHDLAKISGITRARAAGIYEAYMDTRSKRDLQVWLRRWELTSHQCAMLIAHFGSSTLIATLTATPYRMMEVNGIGFLTADAIARRLGVERDNIERAKAIVLHVLAEACTAGHCYVPLDELISKGREHCDCPRERLHQAVSDLLEDNNGAIVQMPGLTEAAPARIILARIWEAEIGICAELKRMTNGGADD